VKALGRHTVKVKLHADVTIELPFDVVSENPILAPEAPAKPEAPHAEEGRGERRRTEPRKPPRKFGDKV
jgi:large subunit ribosomal protein L9